MLVETFFFLAFVVTYFAHDCACFFVLIRGVNHATANAKKQFLSNAFL